MGLLTDGSPLSWNEIVAVRDVFRSYALSQLVRIFEKYKDRQGDRFLWGDELEFSLVHFNHSNKQVQLLLNAHEVLPSLTEMNKSITNDSCRIAWHIESCDYMIEGVPYRPYDHSSFYFNTVEANMALRRKQAQKILSKESDCEYVVGLSAFPQYGENKFIYPTPQEESHQSSTQSLAYSNAIVSPNHPRMKSLITNKYLRRKSLPLTHIPIFRDSATPWPFRDHLFEEKRDILDNHLYLEGVLAGWGCCCLQVTFQAESLTECLQLYDQLLPLTAIMLALSGASPIWRGYLTDIDCRYDVLSQAGDDRTPEERQSSTLSSRCCPTPLYLSEEHQNLNDIKVDLNERVVSTLIDHGMSPTLSRHFGHLFVRDPLVIIKEHLHPTNDLSSYHFENLNSTVWYSLRLKPPTLENEQTGWRVEFRPMDIQITDFENAALAVFMALMTRVVLRYNLDLTIPISHVNENMARAHHRDSVRQEKFHFRIGDESSMMSIDEIINGMKHFPGLVPLARRYLNEQENIDSDTRQSVEQYLSLISKRAAGVLLTDASWIRQFVMSHPQYKHDSVVSDEIQYDLLWKMVQITNGYEPCPLLIDPQLRTQKLNSFQDFT